MTSSRIYLVLQKIRKRTGFTVFTVPIYESPTHAGRTPFVVMCLTQGETRFIPAADAAVKPSQPALLLRFAGVLCNCKVRVRRSQSHVPILSELLYPDGISLRGIRSGGRMLDLHRQRSSRMHGMRRTGRTGPGKKLTSCVYCRPTHPSPPFSKGRNSAPL